MLCKFLDSHKLIYTINASSFLLSLFNQLIHRSAGAHMFCIDIKTAPAHTHSNERRIHNEFVCSPRPFSTSARVFCLFPSLQFISSFFLCVFGATTLPFPL